jgi:hypothetical protein
MELQRRRLSAGILLALTLSILGFAAGCSNNDTIKEDPAVAKKRLDSITVTRSLFDKSHGSYDALSPEDKAKLNAETGSEAHSRDAFGHMGGGSSHAPAGG